VHDKKGILTPQVFKRQFPSQNCDAYASRIQSYCDDDDIYCDSGRNRPVHHGYVDEYSEAALRFILQKLA
jgi:acetylxylan esterase